MHVFVCTFKFQTWFNDILPSASIAVRSTPADLRWLRQTCKFLIRSCREFMSVSTSFGNFPPEKISDHQTQQALKTKTMFSYKFCDQVKSLINTDYPPEIKTPMFKVTWIYVRKQSPGTKPFYMPKVWLDRPFKFYNWQL